MVHRGRAGSPLYFEELRQAASRLPEGLIRLAPPAEPADLAAAERKLGRKLPHGYAELLRSWNGGDLFGDSLVLFGVGPAPFGSLLDANQPPRAETIRARASRIVQLN